MHPSPDTNPPPAPCTLPSALSARPLARVGAGAGAGRARTETCWEQPLQVGQTTQQSLGSLNVLFSSSLNIWAASQARRRARAAAAQLRRCEHPVQASSMNPGRPRGPLVAHPMGDEAACPGCSLIAGAAACRGALRPQPRRFVRPLIYNPA